MNPAIREMVNQKVRQLDVKELIRLSRREGIPLSVKEAKRIIAILNQEPFDIGNHQQLNRLKKQFEKEFPQYYSQAMTLLKPYEHLLQ